MMDRKAAAEWQSIFRDAAITLVGCFMEIFEVIYRPAPNIYVLGAGITLLGVPPALRLDQARRIKNAAASSGLDPLPEDS